MLSKLLASILLVLGVVISSQAQLEEEANKNNTRSGLLVDETNLELLSQRLKIVM